MSGQGAYLFGGRWNTPEHRAVYLSGTLTLAMLEVLVHTDSAEAFCKRNTSTTLSGLVRKRSLC